VTEVKIRLEDVLVVDVETTSTDVTTARIVEIGACRLDGTGEVSLLVHPGIPIPAEATEVHGITNEDVTPAPAFEAIAGRIQKLIDRASAIAGYNSRDFDCAVLDAELRRAGRAGIPDELPDLDAFRVWQAIEGRTLADAVARFGSLEANTLEMHRASSDALATASVIMGMADRFRLSIDSMVELTRDERAVDRAGKFRYDDDGEIVFAFGKHCDRLAKRHGEYLRWMLGADFPPSTKDVCRRILKGKP